MFALFLFLLPFSIFELIIFTFIFKLSGLTDLLILVTFQLLVLHAVDTRPAHDVPRTSPEGPLKVLTSGTYRGPSGDSRGTNSKTDNLMKKLFFRSNSPCITYLFLFFTGRTNIQKFLTATSTGPSCGTSRGPNDGTF